MSDHRTHARRPDGRTYCGRARAQRVAGPHEIEDVECESCLRALPGLRAYAEGSTETEAALRALAMTAKALHAARWWAERLRTDPDTYCLHGGPCSAGTEQMARILAALDPSRDEQSWCAWLREDVMPAHRRGTGRIAEGARWRAVADRHWGYTPGCDCPWCEEQPEREEETT